MDRFDLIASIGEEVLTEEDLKELLKKKESPIAYNGFEPSGKMHIAQSVMYSINVNKLLKAGCRVKVLVADWHAQANNKLGGDLEKIQTTGKYFVEVWKAAGMSTDDVEFIWASDLVKDPDYWQLVLKIGTLNTVDRITRCSQIMGRSEKDALSAAQILYPLMQCADIFYMDVDICQLGMDQRKVNVLAREVAEKLGYEKPIVVSHHMLLGLVEPPKDVTDTVERTTAMKMSKSNPKSAIFSHDSPEEVEEKLKAAYCPAGQAEENPVLEYCRHILFEKYDEIIIERPEKFGGNITFPSYSDLERSFVAGDLHPLDLKKTVARYVNELLEPIRKHFAEDENARQLKEAVESYAVTR